VDARARIDELMRTLGDAAASLGHEDTVRRGTLVVRSAQRASVRESGTRSIEARIADDFASLPRLEVGTDRAPKGNAELDIGVMLGAGGMGAVWLARQRSLRRDVAVKRLKDGPEATQGVGALLTEARTTGALEHPSIVPVHVLGVDAEGSPLLVMKRIEGATLESLARDREHATWKVLERRHGDRTAVWCELLMRVADALHFAHSRGYFHRDLKPSNVMVGSFGEVYLLDWGVALSPEERADEATTHEVVGTPSFMAPEMVTGDPARIDARTDVYLLGATLHALLTDTARHAGSHLAGVLYAAVVSMPVKYDASIDAGLGEIANRATSARPEDRYESALAFADALAEHLRHRGSMALSDAAEAKLAALASDAPLASPETTGVLHECRFGLDQALLAWPENVRAREALDRTLDRMLEAELARRSPEGALAIARAMRRRDPRIDERIEALRAEIAEAKRLEEEGRAEERERALTPTTRYRVPYTFVVLGLSVLLFLWAMVDEAREAEPLPMARIVPYDVVMLGLMSSGLWVLRNRILTNRIARQLASLLLLSLASATFVDQIHASRGETSEQAGPVSIMMIGAVYLGAAIGIGGRLWVAAGICYVAALVAALWPAASTAAVGGGIIGCLVTLVYDGLGARTRSA
jgi:serine/threonine-protein kinase